MALSDDLISYWKLDEASGDALDAHGSNDLTDNNTVGTASGKVGNARDFELDNSEKFTHTDNADLSTGDIDFTFALWVKLETITTYRGIIDKAESGTWEYRLIYNHLLGGVFNWAVSGDGSSVTQINSDLTAPSPGTWYFIVAWHDATANTINIQVDNGTVASAAHATGVFNGTSIFQIGYSPTATQYMDGLIDEVGFWKRILTPTERTFLYNSGNGRTYEEIVPAPPVITTTTLPDGTIDDPYSETLAATGGTGAITWSIDSGALPAGLSLNSSTGEISGTPTTTETASFTVEVEDTAAATDTQALSIEIVSPFGDYEVLQITPGMRIESIEWSGSVLRAAYGGGYGDIAVVGDVGGLHLWSLHSGGIWIDNTTYGLEIGGKTRFAYYWEFFQTHTTSGADVFILPFRGDYYHASFVETSMSVERFKKTLDIYEGGLEIRQRRVVGETYAANGSISGS